MMERKCGLYVSLEENRLKRHLVTRTGLLPLPDCTLEEEVIDFSERNFHYYAVILDQLILSQQYLFRGEDGAGDTFNPNVYEFMMGMAQDLVETLEGEEPLFGTLTRTALEDNLGGDFNSIDMTARAAEETVFTLTDVITTQFEVNDVLSDLRNGVSLDLGGKYEALRTTELTEVVELHEGLSRFYRFRSLEDYYHFLLIHMIVRKPRVAFCECCGRYFIPKTKAKTKYCDRIFANGKTCKTYGPRKKHRQDADDNAVIEEYDRTKQRMYKRYERAVNRNGQLRPKELSFCAYYDWAERATQARDDYLAGKLSEADALNIIKAGTE